MNSTSSFSVNLVKENLKRFWGLPALFFLYYFFCVLCPIWLMDVSYSKASFMKMLLSFEYPLIIISNVLFPLITAVTLFKYLNQQSSVAVIHSLPFSRKNLFVTNFISGLIMNLAPLIVFVLLLSIVKVYDFDPNYEITTDLLNTLPQIIKFFSITVLTLLYFFSFFVLAAFLTGNTVVHILLSVLMFLIIPGLFLLYNFFGEVYLYGFTTDMTTLTNLVSFTNPQFLVLLDKGRIPWAMLTYGVLMVFAIVLSLVLYYKRKLERATESLVFEPIKLIISYVGGFTGMTLLSVLFATSNSRILFYSGMLVGGALGFFLAQMIIEKSFNVFYKAKSFIYFAIVGIVVVLFFKLDITGYEKWLPQASNVKGVYIGTNGYSLRENLNNYGPEAMLLMDEATINGVLDAHAEIVKVGSQEADNNIDIMFRGYSGRRIDVSYVMQNGSIKSREYVIPDEILNNSAIINDVLNSIDCRMLEYYWLKDINRITSAQIRKNDSSYETMLVLSESEARDLAKQLLLDISNVPYGTPDRGYFEEVGLTYEVYFEVRVAEDRLRSYYQYVDSNFANCMGWIAGQVGNNIQ